MPLWLSHLFSRSRSFTRSPSVYYRCALETIIRYWFYQDNKFNTSWIYLVFSGKCGGTRSKMSSWKVHSVVCCLSRYISHNLEPVNFHISIWNGIILNVTVIASVINMVIIIIIIIIVVVFIVSSVASP
jgi:hypothetical protein